MQSIYGCSLGGLVNHGKESEHKKQETQEYEVLDDRTASLVQPHKKFQERRKRSKR